jgi:membrane protein implicated in regulation of membrane protease activity
MERHTVCHLRVSDAAARPAPGSQGRFPGVDSPEGWRWVWLAATAVFAIGEITSPGSFFLAPFALGALVASILSFAGVSVPIGWSVFLVVSIATLFALRPVARRLDRSSLDQGVGSQRLVGNRGTVVRAIPGEAELGLVLVDREEWRAQSTNGAPIAEGTTVRVADVQGTRVIVSADPGAAEPR